MYFGVFAVGADISAGLLAFYETREKGLKASIAFKSFKAEFLKRAESDVLFICTAGKEIREMIANSMDECKRVNKMIQIQAICQNETVANMQIELSIKVKQNG